MRSVSRLCLALTIAPRSWASGTRGHDAGTIAPHNGPAPAVMREKSSARRCVERPQDLVWVRGTDSAGMAGAVPSRGHPAHELLGWPRRILKWMCRRRLLINLARGTALQSFNAKQAKDGHIRKGKTIPHYLASGKGPVDIPKRYGRVDRSGCANSPGWGRRKGPEW
uniref:Uncharacterized protein TCIL3000_5_3470 n=1 Tax=Trypanosoma congolense (strain IL3000) TaxID=1068625 RepID=G0ULV4_TRYCI|nr:unnamed protein product [Trypanosoma congolense IL3000]